MRVLRSTEGQTEDRREAAIFEGGSVWARPLAEGGKDVSVSMVQFAAGARTRPHRHTSDQVLYVVAGIGKVGAGGEEHVVGPGDCVTIPAGEEHWHGAADTGSPMSHLSILGAGSETTVS